MDGYIQEALDQYDFFNPCLEFIRHNENMTYKIADDASAYVLRIHKPVDGFSLGIYQRDTDLLSFLEGELLLIDYAGEFMDTPMQKPIRNKTGAFVSVLSDGTPVTVLKWVEGITFESVTVTEGIGENIGIMIAKLHRCFDGLEFCTANQPFSRTLNREINRYVYNQKLLNKVAGQVLLAESLGRIAQENTAIMIDALRVIETTMDELDTMHGMPGIVHADPSLSNLILSGSHIVPIDFSLSGYGFHYMDIGFVLSQYQDHDVRNSIKRGYEKVTGNEIPLRYIEPFFALGVLLFIACQHNRIYSQNWFGSAIERWCATIFCPLTNGINFVL